MAYEGQYLLGCLLYAYGFVPCACDEDHGTANGVVRDNGIYAGHSNNPGAFLVNDVQEGLIVNDNNLCFHLI